MQNPRKLGFSIIELMVVVTTIGILALLGLPGVQHAREVTEATTTASDLRVFTGAVEYYTSAEGMYPARMTYDNMPGKIAEYLPSKWKNGEYSWLFVDSRRLTYVYIYGLNFSAEQAVRLDAIVDDGNVAKGRVRTAINGTGIIYLFNYGPTFPLN